MTKKKKDVDTTPKQEDKKTEEEILFPDVTVGGISVKPWSFGKLFDLSVYLQNVLDKAEEKDIIKSLEKGTFISYPMMARIFTIAGPELLKIISITIDKTEEEVKELPMEVGVKIALVIFQQNKETIKNAFSLVLK